MPMPTAPLVATGSEDDGERMLTVEAARKILQLERHTIYKKIRRGELVAHKIGEKWLIKRMDLDNYINSTRSGRKCERAG